ncbi:helix-turn-helix domain-containing protein [Mucilaginibacter sp. X5P1]|uniref:helix-turn-helix domain-containing protein n=1 Tax=Mucilaginibacter sp. X5P1 TaxID=2723088 RepID=UPI001620872C|nr:AraC family transcriptional regulator [Mucilaginibacter sp. X5P1]MBB6137248.1 AraC-like DNA-binding protein [Mucilaginibacter sp. X5P1]
MPFEIKNKADNSILHSNELSGKDFNSEKLVEQNMHLNLPFADVQMKQWYFNGIRMGYSNWHYKERMEMEWKGDLDMVTLYFNMKGKTTITNKNMDRPFELGKYQHNLFYSQSGEGILKNDELFVNTFMIQFNTDAFLRITEGANDVLKRFGDDVLLGKTVALSDTNLYMDINMINAINAIVGCKYQDDLKKMFLLSKSMELLVLQAEAYHAFHHSAVRYLKTEYDKERIIYAREYLVQHLDMPPGLSDLAKVAGINEYKLKKGFKELFGNTVFGYLAETRLELAKTDLLEKNKTASEIAFELGYSSVQHFSTAFKKKFGVSPTKCS